MLVKLVIVEEKFMNTKNLDKIIIFFCIFPAWIFSSNLYFYDKIIFFVLFLLLIIAIYFICCNKIYKFENLFFSFVILSGLDQNFSLEKKLIKINFEFFSSIFTNIYYARFLILIILFLIIFFCFLYFKRNFLLFISPFIIVISLFNYYEIIYQNHKFQNFDFSQNKNQKIPKHDKLLFIILDEMSGVNSAERDIHGSVFKKNILQLSKNNNLNLFTNVHSLSDNTASSVSGLLNLIDTQDELIVNRNKNLKKIDNFLFNEYNVNKNILFDNFSSISTFQNIHLNFCSHENVTKCYQFNPYKNQDNFIQGYKYNILTRFLSIWKIQGSISATILWRIARELEITDSYLEPEIHKATFDFLLNEISQDLFSQNFDLIFAHLLVPHIPYGFDNQCNYDGKLSIGNTFLTNQQKVIQHNKESDCVVFYLDKFFSKIKNVANFENLEILILSDHGSRISGTNDSKYSAILMHKSVESSFNINDTKQSLHSAVKEILLNKYASR